MAAVQTKDKIGDEEVVENGEEEELEGVEDSENKDPAKKKKKKKKKKKAAGLHITLWICYYKYFNI